MSEQERSALLARVTTTAGVCGGRPCVRGLRIRVVDVLEVLADDVTPEQILEDFQLLERDDIRACLAYAAR